MPALPNIDVVDEAQVGEPHEASNAFVDIISMPIGLNVVGQPNSKGRDVSVVERCWAGNSKG
jgi:hypothetical protein